MRKLVLYEQSINFFNVKDVKFNWEQVILCTTE